MSLRDFTLQVSNSDDVRDHVTVYAVHDINLADGRPEVLRFDPPTQARYVSILNSGNHDNYFFVICEAVVIGYKAAGKCLQYSPTTFDVLESVNIQTTHSCPSK